MKTSCSLTVFVRVVPKKNRSKFYLLLKIESWGRGKTHNVQFCGLEKVMECGRNARNKR